MYCPRRRARRHPPNNNSRSLTWDLYFPLGKLVFSTRLAIKPQRGGMDFGRRLSYTYLPADLSTTELRRRWVLLLYHRHPNAAAFTPREFAFLFGTGPTRSTGCYQRSSTVGRSRRVFTALCSNSQQPLPFPAKTDRRHVVPKQMDSRDPSVLSVAYSRGWCASNFAGTANTDLSFSSQHSRRTIREFCSQVARSSFLIEVLFLKYDCVLFHQEVSSQTSDLESSQEIRS